MTRKLRRWLLGIVGCALTVGLLAGRAWAPMVRFSGAGNLVAINRLLEPNGYDRQGDWTGRGSGLFFTFDWSSDPSDVAELKLRTPAGTISLPYTDPGMRYSGTNFNFAPNEPLLFDSADGSAEIAIHSEWNPDPYMRYSGTNLTFRTAQGEVVQIDLAGEPLSIRVSAGNKAAVFSGGGWTLQ